MIRWPNLLQVLGLFILALTVSLGAALLFALIQQDAGLGPLVTATVIAATAGITLLLGVRPPPHEFTHREGILLVVAAWVTASVLGSLPFYFSGHFAGWTDAFFESVSGFTTTGATVLGNVEALPDSLLFWRALTQWIGGMGIILLGIAILPLLGVGGIELYRAEFSGSRSEKLKPRIAETASALWKIYVAFSLGEYVALRWAGMGKFDAICHAFSTMATGGFSTRNLSIASFADPTTEMIVGVFMVIAGVNFTQHYRLFVERRPLALLSDPEFRYYLAFLGTAALGLTISVFQYCGIPLAEAIRLGFFQVISIMTGTGFSSGDLIQWSSFAQLLLLALMFVGGCTGSTTGGLKVARLVLLMGVVAREFRRRVERHGVFTVRFSTHPVSENALQGLLSLVYLSFLINFSACLLLTAVGVDMLTAISAVAAAMFNVGPGLGQVGPMSNYGWMPPIAKWALSFCMLAGRLEFYTLLVILTGAFWRK